MARHRLRTLPRLNIDRGVPGVYAIEMISLPLVKVGFTTDIYQRLASMQTNCPFQLALAAFHPAHPRDEKVFHCILERCSYQGEWFAYTRFLERVLSDIDQCLVTSATTTKMDVDQMAYHLSNFFEKYKPGDRDGDCDLIDDHVNFSWLINTR